MDNKQDRNFYWEVKDFMGKPQEIHKPVKTPNDMVSSIKNILEQNKLYKPSSFNPNINSASTIRQAINAIERNNQKGTPENIQHTKNIPSNPFGVIREGIFDDETSPTNTQFGSNLKNKFNLGVNSQRPNMGQLDSRVNTDGGFDSRVDTDNSFDSRINIDTKTKDITDYDGFPLDDPKSPFYNYRKYGLPSTKPSTKTPTSVPAKNTDTTTDTESDDSDAIGNLRDARGTFVPTRTYGSSTREGNKDDVQKASKARNDSIRSATIAANSSRDDLKAKWNAARAADPSSAETIELQKQLRSMNDEINPASPQQGNISQADIALRYAKPGQRTPNTQSQEETTRIANEFVASQKEGRKPNYQSSTPTSSSNNSTNQPGVDITRQSPGQSAAMNNPARGGQSGKFGGDKNKTTPSSAPVRPTTPERTNTPPVAPSGTANSGMPSKTPTPTSTTPPVTPSGTPPVNQSGTSNSGSSVGLGNGFLNSPTEETAPNIFPNMTLNGKEVNKKAKDLSTLLQA